MTWRRQTWPTGVPYYESDEAPHLILEAETRYSTHVGMVFGNYVNEAGRERRIVGWNIYRVGGRLVRRCRTLAEAKAKAEALTGAVA